jgi:hypothetical protein
MQEIGTEARKATRGSGLWTALTGDYQGDEKHVNSQSPTPNSQKARFGMFCGGALPPRTGRIARGADMAPPPRDPPVKNRVRSHKVCMARSHSSLAVAGSAAPALAVRGRVEQGASGTGRAIPSARGPDRKPGAAIPRGEFRHCDPRRSQATTGASVRLAHVAKRIRTRRASERSESMSGDGFPALRKTAADGQCRRGRSRDRVTSPGHRRAGRVLSDGVRLKQPANRIRWRLGVGSWREGFSATCPTCGTPEPRTPSPEPPTPPTPQ